MFKLALLPLLSFWLAFAPTKAALGRGTHFQLEPLGPRAAGVDMEWGYGSVIFESDLLPLLLPLLGFAAQAEVALGPGPPRSAHGPPAEDDSGNQQPPDALS